MALYGGLQLWLTRGTTLFIDEVTIFIQDRGLRPSVLLAPFNGHLELVRRLFYAVALKLFGTSASFFMARLVEVVGVILLSGLVFVFIRRRVGEAAALGATVLLLFFGSAWELNYAISGIGNVYAMAAGIAALLLLERRSLRAAGLACALLSASVVSFTTGLAFVGGALCLLLLEPAARRRVWVALVPIGIYAAWLLWIRLAYVPAHGEVQHTSLSHFLLIPNVVVQQAASTAGAVAGLNYDFQQADVFGGVFSTSSSYGGLLAALAGWALMWCLRRGVRPMLWGLLAALVVYWVELALGSGPGRTPTTIRYVYASGVIAMLIAAEAKGTWITRRPALVILYGLTTVALLGNLARLRDGMHFYRTFGTAMRAQLTAVELAGPSIDPNFVTVLGAPKFVPVTAGPYLEAVRRSGSAAYSEVELHRQPETLRLTTDSVLVAALRIGVAQRRSAETVTRCQRHVSAPGSSLSIALRTPGVALGSASGGQLALSRYATRTTVPVGSLPPGQSVDLRIPRDRSNRPWRLTITPSPGEFTLCALPVSG